MPDLSLLLTIPESHRAGVTAAREAYNATLPATVYETDADGNTTQVANPALIASDEDYLSFVVGRAVDSYQSLATAPTPAPTPDPVVVNGVPQVVSRRQGIQALINTGNYDKVQPAIDAITDAATKATMQNEWDNSASFERQRTSLIQLATAIGLTTDDLDNLFKLAVTL